MSPPNADSQKERLVFVYDLAMMVPVVFLVLPVTVLFAIFPGLAVLEVGL